MHFQGGIHPLAIQRNRYLRPKQKHHGDDIAFSLAATLLFVVVCAYGLRWIDRHYTTATHTSPTQQAAPSLAADNQLSMR